MHSYLLVQVGAFPPPGHAGVDPFANGNRPLRWSLRLGLRGNALLDTYSLPLTSKAKAADARRSMNA
jgi:hypothetical protein